MLPLTKLAFGPLHSSLPFVPCVCCIRSAVGRSAGFGPLAKLLLPLHISEFAPFQAI